MLRALWVRRRAAGGVGGTFVRELSGDDADPVVPMTPYEARRLAAELNAAADKEEPPPSAGGRPPYGWRYVPRGTIEPDPHEAYVVDLIVSHVIDGYSRPQSTAALNALGLRTRYGNPWSRDSLRQIQLALMRQGVIHEPNVRPYRRRTEPRQETLT